MSTPIVSAPSEEVTALHAQVRHYESELTERDAVIAQRDAMIEHLQEQVRLLVARCFAPSSEKIPEGQLGLFNEAEATAAEEPERAPGTEVAAHRRGTPPVRTGRYIGHDPSGCFSRAKLEGDVTQRRRSVAQEPPSRMLAAGRTRGPMYPWAVSHEGVRATAWRPFRAGV